MRSIDEGNRYDLFFIPAAEIGFLSFGVDRQSFEPECPPGIEFDDLDVAAIDAGTGGIYRFWCPACLGTGFKSGKKNCQYGGAV